VYLPVTTAIAGQAWQSISLGSGWSAYGIGYAGPRYWKDALGVVHLSGLIAQIGGNTNNVLFTLPTGYRPDSLMIVGVTTNSTSVFFVGVTAAGVTTFYGNLSGLTWISLEGITFRAA
jgi:hypothetical protein